MKIKSHLTKEIKNLLTDPKNQIKVAELAEKFDIKVAAILASVRRDSEHLALPKYTDEIRDIFNLPKKVVLTENVIDETDFLSKHN
jgi:glycerate kinase